VARPMAVRSRVTNLLVAGAAAGILAIAGCGTATTPGGGSSATSTPSPAAARVSLSFTMTGLPGQPVQRWTLRCDPPGGTHKDPAAACAALLRMKDPFAPRPRRMICPMILASGRQIEVTGTWFGRKVHRHILDGGCDLGLFGSVSKIFN
jgi:Subtilisin inhibitor-like